MKRVFLDTSSYDALRADVDRKLGRRIDGQDTGYIRVYCVRSADLERREWFYLPDAPFNDPYADVNLYNQLLDVIRDMFVCDLLYNLQYGYSI